MRRNVGERRAADPFLSQEGKGPALPVEAQDDAAPDDPLFVVLHRHCLGGGVLHVEGAVAGHGDAADVRKGEGDRAARGDGVRGARVNGPSSVGAGFVCGL